MHLKNISLVNFKNYDHLELNFSEKINCFTGNNGVGKTNILDAIYYLSFCKSFFSAIDQLSIKYGNEFFVIQADYEINKTNENIYCGYEKEKKKRFKRNKKEYDRLSEHIGFIPLVMISPTDINLIIGGSDLRRKFIDGIISQYNRNYLFDLQKYNKTLLQRNHWLKNKQSDDEMLDLYDQQLIETGRRIFEGRKSFIAEINPIFQDYFNYISQGSEKVTLNYESSLHSNDIATLLKNSREKDKNFQTSTQGIHKDDLELMLSNFLIRKTGSQGQQKTFLLALKLAQFQYIYKLSQMKPILLLDDVFDKLDPLRVQQLINLVVKDRFGQIFISDTHTDRINKLLKDANSSFHHFYIENSEAMLVDKQ